MEPQKCHPLTPTIDGDFKNLSYIEMCKCHANVATRGNRRIGLCAPAAKWPKNESQQHWFSDRNHFQSNINRSTLCSCSTFSVITSNDNWCIVSCRRAPKLELLIKWLSAGRKNQQTKNGAASEWNWWARCIYDWGAKAFRQAGTMICWWCRMNGYFHLSFVYIKSSDFLLRNIQFLNTIFNKKF